MTWSLTRSKIIGGQPIVKWNGQPLIALDADALTEAVTAANALADDIVTDSAGLPMGDALATAANEASVIVAAVLNEMARRNVESVGDVVEETRH